jgi:two-component system, cell cycle sensor histidine kinase and response regulator CckA
VNNLLEHVSHLLTGTIVIYARVSSDITGKAYSPIDVAIKLSKASNAPVFCLATSQLDTGVVGGSMVDVEALSTMLGRILPSLMSDKPLPLEPASHFLKPMVNWQQIKRWGVSASRVPDNAFIINRPPTLWSQYKVTAIITMAVFFALTFLIIALVMQNYRRRIAEKSALESEVRYRILIEQAPDAIVVYDSDLQRFVDANASAERLFGCNRNELLQSAPQRFYQAEQPDGLNIDESVKEYTLRALAGEELQFDRVVHSADGRNLFCEVRLVRLPSENRKLTRASFIDITDRKIAEDTLRVSEKRFRAIFERSTIGNSLTAPDGKLLRINKAFADMLGYTIGELEQINFAQITHPEDMEKSHECIKILLENEQTFYRMEKRYIHKNGGIVWVDISTTLLRDEKETPLYFITSIADITDRKQAEEALKSSHRRLDDIIDFLPDATFVIDCDGKVIAWNRSIERMTEVSKEDMIGRGSYEYAIPFYGQRRPVLIDLALQPDEVFENNHYEHVVKEGDTLYAEAYVPRTYGGKGAFMWGVASRLCDASGNIIGAIESIRDITDRKQAEDELQEKQNRLLQYQRIAHVGGWELDLLTNMLTWSDEIYQIFEIDKNRFRATYEAFLEVIHPEDRGTVNAAYTQSLVNHQPYVIIHRLLFPDGRIKYVQENCETDYSPEGKPLRSIGIVQDITELKQAEEEKMKLQDQLTVAQKMEAVGRLAGGVAHDFNNMLSVILGHAELVLEEVDPSQPLHASLKEIHNAAKRSTDLTRQLLAFARKQTVQPIALDLNKTVNGMLKMLERLIGEDIELVWRPGSELWPVKMDPSQIDQLLANLCINARDAVTGVGKITIETGNMVFDDISCSNYLDCIPGEYVMLAVSDNGSGMDKDTLDHIFEPFFTTKGIGQGTGLGLATVYGIVKQNEGFINVSSEPGKGATFKIYLQRCKEKDLDQAVESMENLPLGHGETVLMVEDDAAALNIGKVMLEHLGYTVLSADTPEAALRLAKTHIAQIALLITDVIMPEMNGRELAKLITDIKPGLKCLFCSGYTTDVITHRGMLNGGVHFLQKPYSVKDLAIKVQQAMK